MKKLLIALLILMLGTMPALAATEIPGLTWERSMEKIYATEFNVDYYEGRCV